MVKFKDMTKKEKIRSLVLYAIGIVFMPLGVVMTINAHLGAGGIDALNFIIADRLGINTSVVIYAMAVIMVLITAAIRKTRPRITTFISSFFLGIFTDIWRAVLAGVQGESFIPSVLILCGGMLVIAVSVAAYMLSNLPTNPNDDFVVALTEKGWKVSYAKILLDGSSVLFAFILGGEIGIGTIIITFGLGPIIGVFHNLIKKMCKQAG